MQKQRNMTIKKKRQSELQQARHNSSITHISLPLL